MQLSILEHEADIDIQRNIHQIRELQTLIQGMMSVVICVESAIFVYMLMSFVF